MAQSNAPDAWVIGIDRHIQTCLDHLHQWMSIKRIYNAGLVIARHADFKGCDALTCQRNNILIFEHPNSMTDSVCSNFFNRLFYILGGTPFSCMNGYM